MIEENNFLPFEAGGLLARFLDVAKMVLCFAECYGDKMVIDSSFVLWQFIHKHAFSLHKPLCYPLGIKLSNNA